MSQKPTSIKRSEPIFHVGNLGSFGMNFMWCTQPAFFIPFIVGKARGADFAAPSPASHVYSLEQPMLGFEGTVHEREIQLDELIEECLSAEDQRHICLAVFVVVCACQHKTYNATALPEHLHSRLRHGVGQKSCSASRPAAPREWRCYRGCRWRGRNAVSYRIWFWTRSIV